MADAAPAFESLLPGSTTNVGLPEALYNEADQLVKDLAAAGSSEFGNQMLQTWEVMSLDNHIGESATKIWTEIQGSNKVFLPLIVK